MCVGRMGVSTFNVLSDIFGGTVSTILPLVQGQGRISQQKVTEWTYVPLGRGRVGERVVMLKACSTARLLSISISFNRSASLRLVVSDCNISSKSLTASLDLETSRLALASCSESRIEVETASADVRRRVAISSRICFRGSSLVCSKAEKGGSWKLADDLFGMKDVWL